MTDATVSLVLGDFYLHGGESDEWTVDVIADGVDWGSPAGVDAAVQTLLQNSTLVMRERYDNREVTFKVRIRAADGVILAAAEAALFAELGKPNEMVWTPPAAYSPPTVFRVVMSDMEPDVDDLAELRCERTYSLHFVCEAFNRSVDEIVTEAEFQPVDGGGDPVAPIDTLVDNGNSATGWAALGSGQSVSSAGGSVRNSPATLYPQLRRTGTVDMTDTQFLVIDAKFNGGLVTLSPQIQLDGGDRLSPIAIVTSPAPGFTRYYYRVPQVPFSTLTVGRFSVGGKPGAYTAGQFFVTEIRQQNNPPASGTLRQKMFIADVLGSAPSEGTVEVYHDTDPLGQVLVYTWPEDGQKFAPPLRPFLTSSGPTTADSSLISGGRNDLAATDVLCGIPAELFRPGTYEVGAVLRSDTAATRQVDVTATLDLSTNGDAVIELSKNVTFDFADEWQYVPLGRMELPPARIMPGTSGVVTVNFSSPDSSGIDMDEGYLFYIETGAPTVVDCFDESSRLWLNAPTLDNPSPSVMRGTLADGSDAYETGGTVSSWGEHQSVPPLMNVFVVAPSAPDMRVRVRYTPAWHTNAGS